MLYWVYRSWTNKNGDNLLYYLIEQTAEMSPNITQHEGLSNIAQHEGLSNITQHEWLSSITQHEGLSKITQHEGISNITQHEGLSNITSTCKIKAHSCYYWPKNTQYVEIYSG
jgi:hypothetical protein